MAASHFAVFWLWEFNNMTYVHGYQIEIQIINSKTYFLSCQLNFIINRKIYHQ